MEEILKSLEEIVEKFPMVNVDKNFFYPGKYNIDEILSENFLRKIQQTHGNLDKASNIKHNDNRMVLSDNILYKVKLKQQLEQFSNIFREYSGFFWYPCDGFCGWHTNNNAEGERIYFAWAAEDNKSFFRYQDPETKEIITDWDKKGWQYRKFNVSREKPFWHCVGSKTNRISIGLRLK
jgi:hypothetical protein